MSHYVLFTDSACDISADLLAKWKVSFAELSFNAEGKTYTNSEMPVTDFYKQMRGGTVFKTTAVNIGEFKEMFVPELEKGNDLLYIGFSSGLSNTVNAARLAAEELREAYPQRKLVVVDSLCASSGQGLLVYLAVKKMAEGASLEEVAAYAEETKKNLCHWFTVDDLVYLKRGGRVSATAALAGAVLGIKPVLHVDDEGHLINVSKVRGRKQSIQALFKKYQELALDKQGEYFISHGDCLEDAKYLEGLVEKEYGVKATVISDIGPVIGSHSGPGTLAFFFLGKNR